MCSQMSLKKNDMHSYKMCVYLSGFGMNFIKQKNVIKLSKNSGIISNIEQTMCGYHRFYLERAVLSYHLFTWILYINFLLFIASNLTHFHPKRYLILRNYLNAQMSKLITISYSSSFLPKTFSPRSGIFCWIFSYNKIATLLAWFLR